MYMLKLFLGYHVEMIYSIGKKKKMRDMLLLISILTWRMIYTRMVGNVNGFEINSLLDSYNSLLNICSVPDTYLSLVNKPMIALGDFDGHRDEPHRSPLSTWKSCYPNCWECCLQGDFCFIFFMGCLSCKEPPPPRSSSFRDVPHLMMD